jgi:hypothetical protein
MSEHSNDPAHWHSCAEEARSIAKRLKVADAKHMMSEIARNFERLAERAERRLADEVRLFRQRTRG